VLAEIRDSLEVRHQMAGQPYQLDITLAFPLNPPARLNARSNPTHENQYDHDDQNDTDDTAATMTESVTVAAEAAAEAAKQENNEDDNEDGSRDMVYLLSQVPTEHWASSQLRRPNYFVSTEMPRSPTLILMPVVFCCSW
jgi:hypothetical protein